MANGDAFAATVDPRMAPSGDALAARSPSDPLDADFSGLIQQQQRQIADYDRTMRQREAAMAPLQAQAAQITRQPLPTPPTPQATPPAPQRNQPGADEAWLMAAMVLGAIGGGLTRQHVTNGLAAMTGALEGYNEGNKQRFEQELKKWSEEGKAARAANDAANERYKQILESRKLSLDQKLQELQLTAARYDDRATMQLAQMGNLQKLGDLMLRRDEAKQRMEKAVEEIKQQRLNYDQRERLAQEANASRERAAAMRANARGGTMSPEAIDDAVDLFLSGNTAAAMRGMRAGSPDIENFRNRLAEVRRQQGMTAEDINREQQRFQGAVAGARSTGTRIANLEQIQRSVNALVPQALDASAALTRYSRWVPVNQAIQAVQAAKGTPELEAFATVNINLAEQWARSQKPTGVLDVELQKLALGRLSTAKNDQAYRTIVNQIVESIDRERRAAEEQARNAPMQRPQVPGAFVPPRTSPRMTGEMPVPDAEGWRQLGPDIRIREIPALREDLRSP